MTHPSKLCNSIADAMGSTPLVSLAPLGLKNLQAWAKLEQFNPGGSAKDRTARAMVEKAHLTPGTMVIESSSGNLGLALSREAVLGHWDFHCVVDPRVNKATVAYMKALGATVHQLTEPDPETGDWLVARRKKVAELLKENPQAINLDQYSNTAAFEAHATGTMREIHQQLGHAPDFVLVAVSTTGTIGGCQRYLHEYELETSLIAVDAEGSVLFGGQRGARQLPGFGAGVVPELSEQVRPDRVMRIADGASISAARKLARSAAIMPGASGGAVIAALQQLDSELTEPAEAVVVIHDSGNFYLETIYNDEWVRENVG
ncbi:putative siderophore biosynthesis protein SbnA [Corynebacterium kalinowskii]|uniref:Siderophore biosynthesis protein SbnA n=1 Tax=Corynebacterium kalinowskii TaxID=2675216 RepID=A0A6B8VUI1_9CORY|nr:pyridoxal-phosphate dependent enzyme [Corynebacterium kalinowskii]QGU00910.1 putative siderophore biosynthesis protein SbnA [Corynebacterium kalinowskii]